MIGTLKEIYDKVEELNKAGKNAIVHYGPYKRDLTVEEGHPEFDIEGPDETITPAQVYEALITQMKD